MLDEYRHNSPNVYIVVSASGGVLLPRRIVHHFTYSFDDIVLVNG